MMIGKLEKLWVNSKWQSHKNIKIAEPLFDQVNMENVKRVLEVGCGNGVLSSYLAEKYGWNVTGIDIDPEQIKIAKMDYEEKDNLKFIEADASKLPYGNNEFDLVLSFDVLHHIPNWVITIEEINRVLKPNGFYVLSDLAFSNFLVKNFRGLLSKFGGLFTVDEINHQLKMDKFDILYEDKSNSYLFTRGFSIVSQKRLT